MAYEIFRNLYETNFDKDVSPWPVEPPRGHIVTFLDVFECEGLLYVTDVCASCSTLVLSKSERKRNNIIKIYSPPDLSVTMTHFIYQQTVHTHYVVKNLLNHNKNMLPLLHMHLRSYEFIKTKLSGETKKW